MRNIALLEWGPASLFYLQPRERIKVRTGWLDDGPMLPSFLSTMEEAKAHPTDLTVRYALSAFEDLNSAIKNLRRCFGFPYQEYIGYLNTLTRTHRARREHEALIDRLRRWAIYCNVDAVIWIDYTKANQPPGSFKIGPRDSRPFNPLHMEMCTHVPGGGGGDDNEGDDSEAAWSDIDEDHHASGGAGGASPSAMASVDPAQQAYPLTLGGGLLQPVSIRQSPPRRFSRRTVVQRTPAAPSSATVSAKPVDDAPHVTARDEVDASPLSPPSARTCKEGGQRPMLQSILQEEVVPAPGSIYTRSIAPGPGYYGVPGPSSISQDHGVTFGAKARCLVDSLAAASKELPGPGDYKPKAPFTELPAKMGRFGKAERLMPPAEAARKLPFISALASKAEGYAMHSPGIFHSVTPEAVALARGFWHPPKYSFSRSRRPW